MVCGVFEKRKQAVGYVLSNAGTPALTLHEFLKTCLSKLVEAGLKPKVQFCNQGTTKQSLYNSYLKVSADKPFFEFEGHEIITMFESPHLVRSVRNMLLSQDFSLDRHVISWRHIVQMFQEETSKLFSIGLAPKLTDKHVKPPLFGKMKVKLATQTLSNTVASALVTYSLSPQSRVPSEAVHTANFMRSIDSLFDVFNSSTPYSPKALRSALREGSPLIEFLNEMEGVFARLVALDSRGSPSVPPCFKG